MAIFNLYSKRRKKLRGEVPEVFTYNVIPSPLRVQIVHIIQDAVGINRGLGNNYPKAAYKFIHETLCREYGVFTLGKGSQKSDEEWCVTELYLDRFSVASLKSNP